MKVYKITGTATGTGSFSLGTWDGGTGGSAQFYYADKGTPGVSY